MLEAELDEVLDRSRYARRAKRSTGESEKHGHRHGHRSRRLLGTFGQLKIEVPRARLDTSDGKTTEWKSKTLRGLSAPYAGGRRVHCRLLPGRY